MSIQVNRMVNGELSESESIAIDIETQGFDGAGDDEVTVVGLYPSSESDTPVSLLNVGGDLDTVSETALVEYFDAQGIDTLHIILCESEAKLLDKGLRAVVEKLDSDQRLIGYNAEKWAGGFDFPFLRTRFIKNGIDWYFNGIYYCDFINEIQNHINTQQNGDEHNDLDGAHDLLVDNDTEDPFEDSGEAVTKYNTGEYAPVIHHCHADVKRTIDLFELVLEYTPAREPSELKDSHYL